MKKRIFSLIVICIVALVLSIGPSIIDMLKQENGNSLKEGDTVKDETVIPLSSKTLEFENGFSVVSLA